MSKPIIIAADVSKGYADFIVVDSDKKTLVEPFQLDDNKSGHMQLRQQLVLLHQTHKSSRILLVVESTGGYEDNWLRMVKQPALAGFVEGYRLNAKITHHEYRVQKRNSISDGVSTLTIARHVAKNLEDFAPRQVVVDPRYAPARSLIRHITSLDQDCTGHKNSLQKLLYQYLPSLVPFVPKNWSRYFLQMLVTHGSKRAIQLAAAHGLKQIQRVPKGKAGEVHRALRDGIDMKETPPMVVMAIQSKARQILMLQEEIATLEKQLCQMAPVSEKQVGQLCSIAGMGRVTATILLCFIEDVDRFDSAKAMAAFFGVQPRVKTSGDGSIKIGMSKQGNGIVRRMTYLLAFRTLGQEPYLKSIYAKFRQQKMTHDAALGVLMHKLLRIIYGMLKSGEAFDPGVDQLNQIDPRSNEETPLPKPAAKPDPKRRFQPVSQEAPLSNRKRRQRKQDQEPQAATVAESTGSS